MSNFLTANRVAAVGAFCTGLAGALLGLEGSLPTRWGNAVSVIAGGLGSVATCLHFMSGSQKWDQLQASGAAATSDGWAPSAALSPQAPEPTPQSAPEPAPQPTLVPAPAPVQAPPPAPPAGGAA